MIVYPNAKINIGLNIVNRRSDGFHDLETIFYPVPLYDILKFETSADGYDNFSVQGINIDCNGKKNLVEKVLDLLRKRFDVPPLDICLTKQIPIGAGLGGGSSDAAFFVKAINDEFKFGMSVAEMENLLQNVGSDCAFFVHNTPKFATGRGEIMKDALVIDKKYKIVIIKPDISISTALAYSKVKPQKPLSNLLEDFARPIQEWKSLIKNDFEQFLFPLFPELQQYKNALYDSGAIYAAMTGSGSALFGFYENEPILPENLNRMRVL